ncbi:MAG: hypothetical protein V3S69_02640 [Dehalococcoidales bacterium]
MNIKGTVTGRMTSKGPNLTEAIRKFTPCPRNEKFVLADIDYNKLEQRVAAHYVDLLVHVKGCEDLAKHCKANGLHFYTELAKRAFKIDNPSLAQIRDMKSAYYIALYNGEQL